MTKFFYLSTCSTCQRIIKELKVEGTVPMKDIKQESITEPELDEMAKLAGSFESLFSKRAMKFRGWGLHEKELSEKEMRDLILKEYTFLKRPVLILDKEIFVGNSAKVVAAAKAAIS